MTAAGILRTGDERPEEPEGLTGARVIATLRRAWWIPLVGLLVGAAVGWALARTSPTRYTATTSLLFTTSPSVEQLAGITPTPDTSPAQGVQDTNVSLLHLAARGAPAAVTARGIGDGVTPQEVTHDLSIAPDGDTEIVAVAATASTPERAVAIADGFARAFVGAQRRQSSGGYRASLQAIERQLAALPRGQRNGAQGLALRQRAQTLAAVTALDASGVQVAAAARLPTAPSSPAVGLSTVLGGLVGLALGVILLLLRARGEQRLDRPERLAGLLGAPLLASVPSDPGFAVRPAVPGPSGWTEALARVRLRLPSRSGCAVAVCSADPGEGRTSTAFQLAVACARAGARTLLLEADLRRPALAARLGIEGDPGLAGVLAREGELDDAVRRLALRRDGEGRVLARLDLLPAGSIPPLNPAELLGGASMRRLLERARERYDCVVVDTPALGAASESLALAMSLDGVLFLADAGRIREDTATGAREMLRGVGVPVLGVVLNRVRAARGAFAYEAPVESSAIDPPPLVVNGHRSGPPVAVRAGDRGWPSE